MIRDDEPSAIELLEADKRRLQADLDESEAQFAALTEARRKWMNRALAAEAECSRLRAAIEAAALAWENSKPHRRHPYITMTLDACAISACAATRTTSNANWNASTA